MAHTHSVCNGYLFATGKSNQFTQALQYICHMLFTYNVTASPLKGVLYCNLTLTDMYSKRISPFLIRSYILYTAQTCWSCGKTMRYKGIFIANYFKKSIASVGLFCLFQTLFFPPKALSSCSNCYLL